MFGIDARFVPWTLLKFHGVSDNQYIHTGMLFNLNHIPVTGYGVTATFLGLANNRNRCRKDIEDFTFSGKCNSKLLLTATTRMTESMWTFDEKLTVGLSAGAI